MKLELRVPGQGVDFHMHTLASDGLWTPEELVETAAAQGLRAMTVSDHDTIKNVPIVKKLAEAQGIQFVPGVEVTVDWRGVVYHLLLLNFDPKDAGLNAMLDETQANMWNKKQVMLEELKKRGYKLNRLEELKRADGDFLAIDIARALVRGGEVPTFERAIVACAEVGLESIITQPAERALAVGLAAGATPVLAHPARAEYGFQTATDSILKELTDMGLGGVEAYHHSHKPEEIERLLNFARANKLAVSCGSDSHNSSRKPMPWNPELCRSLLERLDLRIEMAA